MVRNDVRECDIQVTTSVHLLLRKEGAVFVLRLHALPMQVRSLTLSLQKEPKHFTYPTTVSPSTPDKYNVFQSTADQGNQETKAGCRLLHYR